MDGQSELKSRFSVVQRKEKKQNKLDGLISYESLLKMSAVYLQYQLIKSHLLQSFTDLLSDGLKELLSSFFFLLKMALIIFK